MLQVRLNTLFPHLPANTAFLVTAKGSGGIQQAVGIDVDGASLQRLGDRVGAADIPRPESRGEAVAGIVRLP